MNELEIIDSILPIIDCPRQIGKTTKLIEVAKELDGIFVALNDGHKKALKREYKDVKITTLGGLYRYCRGYKGPIIFDTTALKRFLSGIRDKLYRLKGVKKKLKNILQNI
ncbi:MAG: hypothetical protein ACOC4M_15985 [Promethearchaeia archaeon]